MAAAPPVAHRQGSAIQRWLAWSPLALLVLAEACVWFVTTFVVLCPLVAPGFFIVRSQPLDYSPTRAERALGWLLLLVYQILVVLGAISVARAVLTPPGEIPSWLRSDGRSDLHSYSNLLQALERKADGSPRFCRKTFAYKPDRAHYCAEVGGCVLQFQDYSLMLNTAIGFHNYKFYLLSLLYGALIAVWVALATAPELALILRRLSSSQILAMQLSRYVQALSGMDSGAEMVDLSIGVTFAFSVAIGLPCFVLLCLHLHLISRGLTLYEWQGVRRGTRRPTSLFDYGVLNNFALALGVRPHLWLLPTSYGIEGNGIFFPEKVAASRHTYSIDER